MINDKIPTKLNFFISGFPHKGQMNYRLDIIQNAVTSSTLYTFEIYFGTTYWYETFKVLKNHCRKARNKFSPGL